METEMEFEMKSVLQKLMIAVRFCFIILLFVFTGIVSSQTYTGIPHVIAFQGLIAEKDGQNIPDGNYDISFALYDVKEGGNPIWTERHPAVKIENGILSIILGKKDKDNPISCAFDRKLYLDINIDSDINLHQRVELGGTAYSLASDYAELIDDFSVTTNKFADESVTDEKIESVSFSSFGDVDPDPYSVYWTIQGNWIWGPERNYIGTVEAKDFVIKTFSIERMRFGPYGRVTMGTPTDTVEFTVIGKTKTQDCFIKGHLGVGVRPSGNGGSKVHINTPNSLIPFRVDVDNATRFTVDTEGRVVINSDLAGSSPTADNDRDAYPLFLNSEEQGIGIKVEGSSDNDNNFVSFWNGDGMQGRIEGENYVNYISDAEYLARDAYVIATGVADVIAMGLAGEIEPASAIAFTAEVLFNTVVIAMENVNLGVTYQSASGDYAEWLEKINQEEVYQPGDVIGIYNGRISKNTNDADQLSSISLSPIALGNKPPSDKAFLFEKVAFLGQVPIKVVGKVNPGDYIIPSGLNNGVGIAVAPELMTIDEYLNVVGRAWEESDKAGIKFINTAIGFDNNELIKLIQLENKKQAKLSAEINSAEKKIKEIKQKLLYMNSEVEKVFNQLNNPDKGNIKTTSEL